MLLSAMTERRTYLVGGAVRDELLGREVKDRDFVVVGATAADLLAEGYTQVGADFPVFLHPDTREEYALARTERGQGRGHRGFACSTQGVTLEEDLRRRDLTVNAMARGEDGVLVDPFGGREDLRAGVLRHVSEAFTEDPLRVLRVARFAARYDFVVAGETQSLLRRMVNSGSLATLTPERVAQELMKALGEAKPRRFFEVLAECGALEVVLPELAALDGVPQPVEHHPEVDTLVHVLLVLDQAVRLSDDVLVRFGALVHDLGKGVTPVEELPHHHDHEQAGVPLVKAFCERLRLPKAYEQVGVHASREHLRVHRVHELRPGKVLALLDRLGVRHSLEHVERLALVAEADARGRTGLENREYTCADTLRRVAHAVRAFDSKSAAREALASGKSGADVGELLRQRLTHVVKRALKA